MTRLLDVNVLIALVDPGHVTHDAAHRWFAAAQADWATCPTTENALLRILGNPRYPNSPGSPAAAVPLLQGLRNHPGHRFWPDALSLIADPATDLTRVLTSDRMTDTYLLALARANGGRLATFDRRLNADAVTGGAAVLELIPVG